MKLFINDNYNYTCAQNITVLIQTLRNAMCKPELFIND